MTPQQFRKIALSLPGTVESEHMGHPDFRVGGKVFASLGAPSADWGMVKLRQDQQQAFCEAHGAVFQPCNGAWGRQGYTNVRLSAARAPIVREAMTLAVENVPMRPGKRTAAKPSPSMAPRKKKSAKQAAESEFDDSEGVSALLRDLEHPQKELIEGVRSVIMKCDKQITEGIKWNAPSFYCHGWFATFHLRTKAGVMLVLHQGAKTRRDSQVSTTINDPTDLLTWASADRATITFADPSDFKSKLPALKSIIKQWVAVQVE